jgi:hypothetical protein
MENFLPNYDTHCTFKMNNTRVVPFFSINTDFKNQQIIVIPPPKHKMQPEKFEKWLFNQVLKDLPIGYTTEKRLFRADKIIIKDSRSNVGPEKTFKLFSKIFDRVLTKKRNYIFDPYSFCLIKRRL